MVLFANDLAIACNLQCLPVIRYIFLRIVLCVRARVSVCRFFYYFALPLAAQWHQTQIELHLFRCASPPIRFVTRCRTRSHHASVNAHNRLRRTRGSCHTSVMSSRVRSAGPQSIDPISAHNYSVNCSAALNLGDLIRALRVALR